MKTDTRKTGLEDISNDLQMFIRSSGEGSFETLVHDIHEQQLSANVVFRKFNDLVSKNRSGGKLAGHTFLPISLFKSYTISSLNECPAKYFESSGTTGQETSRHYFDSTDLYELSFIRNFIDNYGNPDELCILALLPSYLERKNSSLVFMAEKLIKMSGNELSGFFMNDHDELNDRISKAKANGQKILLLGVTFALLDFAEKYPQEMEGHIIMETGGMKGRGKELIREEVHSIIKEKMGVGTVHSEYGMTELFSQAYSKKDGMFHCPPWMRIIISEINDPYCIAPNGKTGIINVIDLANMHSCAFIRTEDLGRNSDDDTFEVMGRLDNSEFRGCNLMAF